MSGTTRGSRSISRKNSSRVSPSSDNPPRRTYGSSSTRSSSSFSSSSCGGSSTAEFVVAAPSPAEFVSSRSTASTVGAAAANAAATPDVVPDVDATAIAPSASRAITFAARSTIRRCTLSLTARRRSFPCVNVTPPCAVLATANSRRTSSLQSNDPTAPSAGVGKNARIAVNAVRTDHEGCHCFGWCGVMLKQIFVPVSNLPFAVSNTNDGGLNGYSGGMMMRPW
mmetsp:Transcript_6360/g.22987  ORF Transcript_6360/g.22987 Transcript_6360/m.22987 type:complete len:225 (+) Transcript_6360:221-895(+)